MKSAIILILFISFSLFSEEPAPKDQEEDRESPPPVSETQPSPSTSKETANTHHLNPLFAYILEEIQEGKWTENRAPGPVFNTCSTWDEAVKCYWAVFRMDNLTGHYREVAYALYNHLTAEGLEKELNYLKSSPDSLDPYSKAWFLLMAVEFINWAIKENLHDSHRISPIAHTLTSELLSFFESHLTSLRKGLDRGGFPFILYALYNYVSLVNTLTGGEFAQPLQTLENSIKTYFFHRNNASSTDQSAKTQTCSHMERAGIHRDYLAEMGLLLPSYEEFEERTAQEDRERIKDCEKEYEAITFSGGGAGSLRMQFPLFIMPMY